MMTQGQALMSDPAKLVWGHPRSPTVFADNLRLRRARDMKVVSMCLSRQYASTHMQLGSRRDLDLRSDFDLDLSRSTCNMFRYVLTRGTRCRYNFMSIVENLPVKKKHGKKVTFTFHDLWRLMYWPCVISDEKNVTGAFHELSFAFLDSE